ncbi:hypothetical protein AMATHDRAFT_163584 [Amanita thiersii Skay4041]|uniref:CCHC-type domain-containing protein n=1 Tax=Amanita thiersii Skay4041 TaxID=703135 RepID=A0A2A9N6X8_9AGAR|nr:hypothetical protein AMATHDRAFT_163584 [Amanita thiersii Skay4041]
MAVPNLPTTLEGWYELTIRLDRQWRQAQVEKKIFTACFNQQTQRNWQPPANRTQQPQWRPLTQSTQRDPNAMQVDRNQSPIRCYNCGQTGHIA